MLDAVTQQPAQPTTLCQDGVRARHVQATTAPAACERRALDGVAASCGAMKREVVKRLRQRRETSVLQRRSRGRLFAFGALSDATTLADSAPQALGEDFFAKGAVVRWRRDRSGHTWSGAISRGQFHRLLRSVRCHCASEGAGLAGFIASAVTERSSCFNGGERSLPLPNAE
ncbi:MAG: hypothetical protein A2W28_01145 [Gammaproteobacteria bacterium RBG_16_51_14]|nr:MAG: hypothetical protein A2W28_01145 [Gammaproteobacteria bacterium RBG_16_51_14]